MSDETARNMLSSAKYKFLELIQHESDIKEQISHWAPIVEQLAKLSGEELDPEILSRINKLNNVNEASINTVHLRISKTVETSSMGR